MTPAWRIVVAGASAFVVVTALIPLCRRFALAHDITDRPAPGKVHRGATPYLGGVAICVAAVASALVLPGWPRGAFAFLAAACLVSVAGLVDDVRGLSATTRLAIEIPAAGLAVAAGARADLFGNWIDFVISVVFLVVLTNAFNLLDNIDGAAGAIGTTIAIALATAALIEGQVLVGGLAVVVAATCLGFLVYNWYPASIFMGDAGSLFLGFILAVIALKLRTGVAHPASALALLLLVGPALFDTTLVVISRAGPERARLRRRHRSQLAPADAARPVSRGCDGVPRRRDRALRSARGARGRGPDQRRRDRTRRRGGSRRRTGVHAPRRRLQTGRRPR